MVSQRGRIFRNVLRLTFSLNPYKTKDPITRLRTASNPAINDSVPEGFTLAKEKTPKGTKYDRVLKVGDKRKDRVILYLHGGAYVAGLLSTYREFAGDYYEATGGCELIMLDYELAPENVYPSQLNEAYDLWCDIVDNQGYKPENIVIAGDSAGANLTLALMLKLRDMGRELPKAGVCMSLWGDMTCSGDSYTENYSRDVLFGRKGVFTKEQIDAEKESLLNCPVFSWFGDADRKDPYISPVFADFSGFPPMFFTVGEDEILLSDTLAVSEKLKALNIYSEVEVGDGMFHAYPMFRKIVPEGKESFERVADFIAKVYKGEIS
ncbi:MAG: alpha/beta hydrolase [Eubacteriales bacterium]|nr:alpha/beta hydrolase [Eubacteriales bacterium]